MSVTDRAKPIRSSPNLRPRERRLALIAGVVIGSWVLMSWLVQPLVDHVRTLHARVKAHTEKLEALSRLLKQAPSITQQYQQVAGYLTVEDDEQAQSVFLNELEGLSRDPALQLNFKPRPMKREERMSRLEVELDIEGPQDKLLAFLDGLVSLPRLMVIERLRMTSIPTKEHWLRANVVVQKLTFHK